MKDVYIPDKLELYGNGLDEEDDEIIDPWRTEYDGYIESIGEEVQE